MSVPPGDGSTNEPGRSRGFGLARIPTVADVAAFLGELRRPEWISAARGLIDGTVVIWTLRRRGVHPLLGSSDSPASALPDAERAKRVAAAVDTGLGLIPAAPTCLRRSMTLMREFRRLDMTATLHIGVRTVHGAVEAHAWVQVGDEVVNDDAQLTDTYTELASGQLETLLPMLR